MSVKHDSHQLLQLQSHMLKNTLNIVPNQTIVGTCQLQTIFLVPDYC